MNIATRYRKDLDSVCMEVSGAEEMLQAAAAGFIDFSPGEDRPPDIRFSLNRWNRRSAATFDDLSEQAVPFTRLPSASHCIFPIRISLISNMGRPRGSFAVQRPVSASSPFRGLKPISDGSLHIRFLHSRSWRCLSEGANMEFMPQLSRANGRCVLLPGTSGAGESTLTIALIRSGFDLPGDNITLIDDAGGLKMLALPEK